MNKKYQDKLTKLSLILSEAIKNDNVKVVSKVNDDIKSLMEDVLKEEELIESTQDNNFAYLSGMFELAMPRLLKKNKGLVKEGIKLIKEDKNLSSQFKFYEALRNYNGNDSKAFLQEALNVFNDSVDKKTIKKSNKKFGDFLRSNNLAEDIVVGDDKKALYEDCDFLLTNKSTLTNISDKANRMKNVAMYLDENKQVNSNGSKDDVFEAYSSKLSTLNESDQELVKQIIGSKTPIEEARRKKLHDNLKNDILEGINKMMTNNEISESEKKELSAIKEDIMKREYCKETIVTDIAKLLEVRDVILDK